MSKRPTLKFKLLEKTAKLPQYAHDTDAGFDIFSTETVTIKKGERKILKTGLSSEIPKGWYVQFFDKSGVAVKLGLHALGGVIDSAYRDEWGVIMINLGEKRVKIEKGDKIVQGVFLPITQPKIVETKKLSQENRGGGFGSTGRK